MKLPLVIKLLLLIIITFFLNASGSYTFDADVDIDGTLTVSGVINGVDIQALDADAMKIDEVQTVTSPIVFENGKLDYQLLKLLLAHYQNASFEWSVTQRSNSNLRESGLCVTELSLCSQH